jgi:hypothetical protein
LVTALRAIHVRIKDEATGEPTPARVRFEGLDGTYYPPLGRLPQNPTDRSHNLEGNVLVEGRLHAYVEGSFEIRLPADPVRVSIAKGPEYTPLATQVTLGPGKMALRFGLSRWIDLRTSRWYSGDGRAHSLTPHAALLEGAAEDLSVVNLLIEDADGPIPPENLLAFSGQVPALARPGHEVFVNTLNMSQDLGRLGLLNSHRTIFPLRMPAEGFEDWTLADLCHQCHRKRGLVTWAYPHGVSDKAGLPLGEALANAILGRIDAFEIPDIRISDFRLWYGLLSSGIRIPLIASSGKWCVNRVLGTPRTYARLLDGEEWSYGRWIEAIRAGRSFMTVGPLLTLQVDASEPTVEAYRVGSGSVLRIAASAESHSPFGQLQIVANGELLCESNPERDGRVARVEIEARLPQGGWVAARCLDGSSSTVADKISAHTSPVFVEVESQEPLRDASSCARLLADLELTEQRIKSGKNRASERQEKVLRETLKKARDRLAETAHK